MIFLLVERPASDLMAYQHSQPSSFFTTKGTDKLVGSEAMARHLRIDLGSSVGAGDTAMEVFLNSVGLAMQVGTQNLISKPSFFSCRSQSYGSLSGHNIAGSLHILINVTSRQLKTIAC